MEGQKTAPRPYCVPVGPIRRVIRDWFREQTGNARGWEINQLDKQESRALTNFCELIWPESKFATAERSYRRLMKETEWMEFELAERILIATGREEYWHCDPELSKIYEELDLRVLDITSPTTEEVGRRTLEKVAREVEKSSQVAVAREYNVCAQTIRRALAA